MNLFAKWKTCKEYRADFPCRPCMNQSEEKCKYPMYYERDILEAVEAMKERILWHSKGCLCGNERKCRERIAELINEVFGVQESQSLTGGGSPIHKVEGTLSAHEVDEAQQTAIPYCKRHQCFHKVFPKYKSGEEK